MWTEYSDPGKGWTACIVGTDGLAAETVEAFTPAIGTDPPEIWKKKFLKMYQIHLIINKNFIINKVLN